MSRFAWLVNDPALSSLAGDVGRAVMRLQRRAEELGGAVVPTRTLLDFVLAGIDEATATHSTPAETVPVSGVRVDFEPERLRELAAALGSEGVALSAAELVSRATQRGLELLEAEAFPPAAPVVAPRRSSGSARGVVVDLDVFRCGRGARVERGPST